jgi:ABC-type Fe3+/spermidine/putrescine transport system ATPase subunit
LLDSHVSGPATLSIRPERFSLSPVASGTGTEWCVEVERIIYIGDRIEVIVRLGPDRLSVVVPSTRRLPQEFTEGRRLYLAPSPEDVRIFPQKTD